MRVRTNRLYPYPVLCSNNDDFVNNKFDVSRDIEYNSENATVVIKASIEDKTILKLIEESKIGLYVNVECSVTKFRFMFEVPFERFDEYRHDIDISQLNENIEITCLLVAKENITFTSDELSEFYKDEIINYPKYSTVGYTDTEEISLIKSIDVNGDIPSIFTISTNETVKEIYYTNHKHQIEIFLPRDEYDIYYNSRGESKRLKQMMINLPVLESVLEDVKSENGVNTDLGWYKVLDDAITKQGFTGLDDDQFKFNSNSLEVSLKMLGDLSRDAFNEFEKLRVKGE